MLFVRVTHPQIERTGVVSARALRHYEARGWRLADGPTPTPDAPTGRPQRNDKTDVWRAYAAASGALTPAQAASMPRDGDDGLIAYLDRLDQAATTPDNPATPEES